MITTGRNQRQGLRLRGREGRAAADALALERHRMAAEIHDLVMQDLAFAVATARMLAEDASPTSQASTVVAAGERALAGARHVVAGLVGRDREPVVDAVEASIRAAARDVPLSFDADGIPPDAQTDQPTLDALVHIGREAVTNAVKHAEPHTIEVLLEHADEWRLRVSDDGRGFDSIERGEGFGLASMRRHAHELCGSLLITGGANGGTTVEARLP
jgi:signal transduction histidine kinase